MPILICFVIFLCSEARLRCAECLESPEETCLKTPKFSACGGLISRSRASIESTSQLKKLVVLANSTPVATWTLSSWRDFRKIPRAFNRVCCFICFVFCKCLWFHYALCLFLFLWFEASDYTIFKLILYCLIYFVAVYKFEEMFKFCGFVKHPN